jgi:RNA polymerase sigma-B factor
MAAQTASPPRPHSARRPASRTARPEPESRQRRLVERYHSHGELRAREELIEELLPLARSMARRFATGGESREDLFQVACLGLIKAVDRFEPGRGTSIRSYVVPTVAGELKRHLRDRSWALRVPRELQERALAATRERRRLTTHLGRSPSLRELSAALGCSTEELLEALEAGDSYSAVSLDAPAARDEDGSASLVDLIGDDDPGFESVNGRDELAQAARSLTAREREVVALRFLEQLTQSEIAARVGCSQMHVSRTLRRALERMGSDVGLLTTGARCTERLGRGAQTPSKGAL